MKRFAVLIALLLTIFGLIAGCSAQPSNSPQTKSAMMFETIGIEGSTVFVTLVSPNPGEITPQELANRLKTDWQNQLKINTNPNYQNQIHVMLFDNKDSPQRWLQIWDELGTMSDQDWAKEQARIFPHRIADYNRNTTSGLNEVQILSRDTEANIVQTIKF